MNGPLASWVLLSPELRALLLLAPLAVLLGAWLIRVLDDDVDSQRVAWPAVLLAVAVAALAIRLLGLPLVPVLPLASAPVGAPPDALLRTLGTIWIGGALLLQILIIGRWLRLRRQLHRARRPAPAALRARLDALATALSVPGATPVRVPGLWLAPVTQPLCVGLRRPCILLPMDAPEWSAATCHDVLAHELVHAERGDPGLLLGVALCGAWLWPVPAANAVQRRWRAALEASCDARALPLAGDPDGYARTLLERARARRLPGWLATLGAGPLRARIERVLAGRAAADLAVGRIYWSLVAGMLVTAPLALAGPAPSGEAVATAPGHTHLLQLAAPATASSVPGVRLVALGRDEPDAPARFLPVLEPSPVVPRSTLAPTRRPVPAAVERGPP